MRQRLRKLASELLILVDSDFRCIWRVNVKRIVISLLWICSALFLLVTADAQAEGRCPPGQYPIGGQGLVDVRQYRALVEAMQGRVVRSRQAAGSKPGELLQPQ